MDKKDLVIFDFYRTLYDPETKKLEPKALEVLRFLKSRNFDLVLVSTGKKERKVKIRELGLNNFFSEIIIPAYKSLKIFKKIIEKRKNIKKVLMIGDRIKSEIKIGNTLGCVTVWLKKGKFAQELPENKKEKPDFIIRRLEELLRVL